MQFMTDWFADLLHVQRILLLLQVKVPVELLGAAASTEPLAIMGLGVGGGDDRGDGRRFPHAAERAAEGRRGRGADEGGAERSGGESARDVVPCKDQQ